MMSQHTCPDCGTPIGQPHEHECDIERCSGCGQQRITCGCNGHDPSKSVWTGEWPGETAGDEVQQSGRQDLPEMTAVDTQRLFPMYDRGNDPLVEVPDLMLEIEGLVAEEQDIPYLAFVSGTGMNLRVEFNDYDAERHKPVVAEGLMCLIDRGASRIVIVAEVWFRDQDGSPTWHGVMILEATEDGDTSHMAPFEGKNQLGGWKSGPAGDAGNLSRLFIRANGTE